MKYTPQQFSVAENIFQTYTIGACSVFVFSGQSAIIVDPTKPIGLDAGKPINVNGPNGAKQLQPDSDAKGSYSATLGGGEGANILPLYLDPGTYSIDNGSRRRRCERLQVQSHASADADLDQYEQRGADHPRQWSAGDLDWR